MEQIENVFMLQIAEILREISLNMLQTRQLELEQQKINSKVLLSIKHVCEKLDGMDSKKVIKMYKDGILEGIEDGKQIKIYYDSLL